MMRKFTIITVSIIVALVIMRFCIVKSGEITRGKQLAASREPYVQLGEVQSLDISKTIEIPGRIESADKVELVARIDGYLQKKHFSEGDFVKKGQVLFTIEPTQYVNALNKARADLETAKANLYKAQRDYDRGDELVKKDFISKSTYDGLYANKLSAQAAVKAAQAALSEAKRNYSYTTIKSPVDGKIGSLAIQEGNYVTVQSGALATVTKTNPIYVKYSVDSKQFEELKKNDFLSKDPHKAPRADIILSDDTVYPIQAKQDFLDNQISTSTGTIDLRATVQNPDNSLIPGDFVKVKVHSGKINNVTVVPQNISMQDATGRYVLGIDENNQVIPKYFKDDGQYENYWIVSEGLSVGDKYIKTNITKLMPQMKVKIQQEQEENTSKEQS